MYSKNNSLVMVFCIGALVLGTAGLAQSIELEAEIDTGVGEIQRAIELNEKFSEAFSGAATREDLEQRILLNQLYLDKMKVELGITPAEKPADQDVGTPRPQPGSACKFLPGGCKPKPCR